ncbi:MAG: hypothetical protein SF123_26255 [Chloroflexota bacterium]|nr:hypothetical protein [Chloroflexota bacterium]
MMTVTGKLGAAALSGTLSTLYEKTEHEGIAPVHMIVDVSAKTGIAPDFYNMENIKKLFQPPSNPAILGWTVTIDPSPQKVVLMLANMTAQVAKRRIQVVSTMEEALALLNEKDPSLRLAQST